MKIRNGFVSNSSSSSFIVAFPEKIDSKEKLKEYLFGDKDFYPHPYSDLYGFDGYSADEVVGFVMTQLDQPIDSFEIPNELTCGWINEFPDFPHTSKYTDEDWAAYDKELKKVAAKVARIFSENNSGSVFYVFEFGDDTALGCAIEHGTLFDNLPHICVSKH